MFSKDFGHAIGDDERKEEVKLTNHNLMAVKSRSILHEIQLILSIIPHLLSMVLLHNINITMRNLKNSHLDIYTCTRIYNSD